MPSIETLSQDSAKTTVFHCKAIDLHKVLLVRARPNADGKTLDPAYSTDEWDAEVELDEDAVQTLFDEYEESPGLKWDTEDEENDMQ